MQGGARAMSVAGRTVEIREAETTTVELVLQDILVNGRLTRNGVSAPGLRVRFWGEASGYSISAGPGVIPQPMGPQRNTAVTENDGTYELLVAEPGAYRVVVDTPDGRSSQWGHRVEIPEVELHTFDIALVGSPVAGSVVDAETNMPIAGAWLALSHKDTKDATASVRGRTGDDGRFQMETEDGNYDLTVDAKGYRQFEGQVTVPPSGELRLALSRGLVISGKVLDAFGKGVPGIEISATWGNDPERASSDYADTSADGAFRFDSLTPSPVTLFAGSGAAGFAVRAAVRPGGPEVVLALRPGGRVSVQVSDAEGRPVEGVWVTPRRVGGNLVESVGGGRTTTGGRVELAAPLGALELFASKDRLEGRATVTVREGESAVAEIRLAEKARRSGTD
jgi:5-hydroxyisourate hydrolase-like protein (transthyretin family)